MFICEMFYAITFSSNMKPPLNEKQNLNRKTLLISTSLLAIYLFLKGSLLLEGKHRLNRRAGFVWGLHNKSHRNASAEWPAILHTSESECEHLFPFLFGFFPLLYFHSNPAYLFAFVITRLQ